MDYQQTLYEELLKLAQQHNLKVTRPINSYYTAVYLNKSDGFAKYFGTVQSAIDYLKNMEVSDER